MDNRDIFQYSFCLICDSSDISFAALRKTGDAEGVVMRAIEILALGADLRREAKDQCDSVNEAYFAVHEVVARALVRDPILAPGVTLHDELSSRVRLRLIENSISRERPGAWFVSGRARSPRNSSAPGCEAFL